MIRTFGIYFATLATCLSFRVVAQDTVRYTGKTLSNVDYHHGQLSPAIGVHNIQVFRANREFPAEADSFGWTYNHAPMMAYWNNTFYVEYLSNPVGEHVPPGQTLMVTSKDGKAWTKAAVVFPQYQVPDGTTKKGRTEIAKNNFAVNHQRMGFHVSKKNRLMVLAYYGIVLGAGDDPNDGEGIGRVIREAYKDGSYGPIYFLRYNHGWTEKNTRFPFFTSSKDKGFVEACQEILDNILVTQQWVEEADRDDPLIALKKDFKAFSSYHLADGRVVGLWKSALTSISKDEGKTWLYNPLRAPGFVNSNAKIWGQKTTDGRFVTVYNPSEFRWPLAVSVSNNGIDYTNLLLVNGEISTMRYGGAYKSYGPQYVRGISEGDGTPPDGKLWVSYSMNKEDIWVSSVPVPVTERASQQANDVFNTMQDGKELDQWNIFSPLWAPVKITRMTNGEKALMLADRDRYDYAKAERVVPGAENLTVDFTVIPAQNNTGLLDIEFQDARGTPAVRLSLDSTGELYTKAGYRNKTLSKYAPNERLKISIELNTTTRFYTVDVNGKRSLGLFFAPIDKVARISFRTGSTRRFPDADTPTDPMHEALPKAGEPVQNASYYITSLITRVP